MRKYGQAFKAHGNGISDHVEIKPDLNHPIHNVLDRVAEAMAKDRVKAEQNNNTLIVSRINGA